MIRWLGGIWSDGGYANNAHTNNAFEAYEKKKKKMRGILEEKKNARNGGCEMCMWDLGSNEEDTKKGGGR